MGCLCGKPSKDEKQPLLQKSASYKAPDSNKAKAIKDYTGKNSTEISFTAGQILDIVDKTQKGYWMGQVEGQTTFGWFPSACVTIIDEKEAIFQMEKQRIDTLKKQKDSLTRESAQSIQKAMTVNASGKVMHARARKSYNGSSSKDGAPPAENASYISFSAGDTIVVTDKSKPDWWLGHIEGQSHTWGWFPADYVEVIDL